MELKEFVKAVINDLTDAISECQQETKNGSLIVPTSRMYNTDCIELEDGDKIPISNLTFDVAITTTERCNDGHEVRAKIDVLSIFSTNIGTSGNGLNSSTAISKINFSIPCVLPYTKTNKQAIHRNRGVTYR